VYAMIRLGNGKFYLSAVFGYSCKVTAADEHQRCLESIHNRYYLVLNQEKNKLVKQVVFPWENKYLEPTVLIVDNSRDDWTEIDEDSSAVSFLADKNLDTVSDSIPSDLLERCIRTDAAFAYTEYPEINTPKDIDRLMYAAGGFHDACIAKLEQSSDGVLYLLFEGVWGCSVEMWLDGDVAYSVKSRNPDLYDPYWLCSAMTIRDGFICFVDEEIKPEEITDDDCWFKARRIKYHIIPN